MIVSFLLPTRGRLQAMLDGIQSIKATASQNVNIELLVRIDEDDWETLAGRDRIPGEVIVGPRWCGYDSIYIFLNEMATKCHGEWIIPWSDDTFMKSQYWDRLLPPADRPGMIWLYDPRSWTWAYPVINRKLYELWGCISPSYPVDAILFEMWKQAGKPIPDPNNHSGQILVEHRRDENNIRALGIQPGQAVTPPPNAFNTFNTTELIEKLRNA